MTATQRKQLESARKSANRLVADLKKLKAEIEARQQRRAIDGK